MRWFRRESDRTVHFTVGVMVMDDDDFKFVGSKETVGDENLGHEEMNRRDGDNPDEDSQDMGSEDALEGEERSESEGLGKPVSTA
ncbi:hypothetical protein CSPX01_01992 [Colletotrichum filicis]|nr:hypothetical protein CSPX01_01992 [Colletotrichum filicis]